MIMYKGKSTLTLLILATLSLLTSTTVFAKAYKGAEVYSSETHLYGRYVTRMKVAKGSGVLSTFFTYKEGSEQPGAFWEEIDIEVFGKNDAIQWQSNIIQGQPRKLTEGTHTVAQSLGDAYHTYTLEWTPTYVAWFVDGTEIRRITGGEYVTSLTHAQGMRFNLWASTSEPWVGAFNDTILPVYQFINFFEYYRYDIATETFTLSWRDDFDSLNSTRWGLANWSFDGNRVDFVPANAVVKDGTLVLALTLDSATGFNGTVPVDYNSGASSTSAQFSSSAATISSASANSAASSTASAAASSTSVATPTKSSKGGNTSFELLVMLLLFGLYQHHQRK